MSVVVNDCYTGDFSLILESAVCAAKMQETFLDGFYRHSNFSAQGNSGQCIGNIVDSRDRQREPSYFLSLIKTVERWMGSFVENNIFSSILGCYIEGIGDDLAGKTFNDLLYLGDFFVDVQSHVFRSFFCHQPEGMSDIIKIFEKVLMI